MRREIRSSPPASDELPDAVRWYEGRRRGLGAESFDAVSATMALIEARPEIGESLPSDLSIRRVLVPRFPYQLVYRLSPTEITIVAFAHLKRRPNYWKRRE